MIPPPIITPNSAIFDSKNREKPSRKIEGLEALNEIAFSLILVAPLLLLDPQFDKKHPLEN